MSSRIAYARAAFVRACELDVAVRKPGNVSLVSPGHGMQAAQFVASAHAAAGPLFAAGASVGERIEGAVAATWAAAGCNTNLGIVLLCAPIAAAWERGGALRAVVDQVLAELDVQDAGAAFRAIVMANPGGLGRSGQADVHEPPQVSLLEAMQAAAQRDSIARQYAAGFSDVFELAPRSGFARTAESGDGSLHALVQRLFLEFLSRWPDSHIVRKHGEPVAQIVMTAAQGWLARKRTFDEPEFALWDESLKQQGINPGTSADLTVASLWLAALLEHDLQAWHGK